MEYSDAYDMANQPEADSGLLINPAVKAAVESQFAMTPPQIPDIVQKKGVRSQIATMMQCARLMLELSALQTSCSA